LSHKMNTKDHKPFHRSAKKKHTDEEGESGTLGIAKQEWFPKEEHALGITVAVTSRRRERNGKDWIASRRNHQVFNLKGESQPRRVENFLPQRPLWFRGPQHMNKKRESRSNYEGNCHRKHKLKNYWGGG